MPYLVYADISAEVQFVKHLIWAALVIIAAYASYQHGRQSRDYEIQTANLHAIDYRLESQYLIHSDCGMEGGR